MSTFIPSDHAGGAAASAAVNGRARLEQADDIVVLLSNAPDMLLAKRIAHVLVEEHLAACVNLGAAMLSMYMWEGVLEGTEEIPLTIKTTVRRAPELVTRLAELHPYEVPEVLVMGVSGGSASYLDWCRTQTTLNQFRI